MKIKYPEIGFEGENISQIVFLKNKHLWFFISPQIKSRYFGGFLFKKNKVLRFLDEINFNDTIEEIQILSPQETIIFFKKNQAYIKINSNCLEINLSNWQNIEINFDIKDIFKNDPFKRKITIDKISSNCLIVNEYLENEGFIKILVESDAPIEFQNNWILKFYDLDKQRNSLPYEWYVFNGIYGKIRELKIKILQPETQSNTNEYELLTQMDANIYNTNRNKNITQMHTNTQNQLTKIDTNIKHQNSLTNNCTDELSLNTETHTNSLIINFLLSRINNLILDSYLPAGFPWFYENWFRDELLSLFLIKNLINKKFFEQRTKFYLYNLETIWDKNKSPINQHWQWQGADTFPLIIVNLPQHLFLAHNTLLEKYLKLWQEKFNLHNLPLFSTWMDTLERKTALEILVLYLKALRKFAKINKSYVQLANNLKNEIINLIKQNPIDINLIFAHLFLEDLFSKLEWQNFFEQLLKENYLDWGGLASISKNDPEFLAEDDGELVKAYHRGDSWYYLNNLLAYSLTKINHKKFQKIIEQVISASLEDLFFDSALGYSSEISSANQRKSQGSLIQLWSIASLMFVLEAHRTF
jgi:hypothetical protein